MPQFSTKRRVRHSAAHMFDLVADVERYPEFVPLCRSLKVRQRILEPEGVEILVADMTVAYKFIRETFTSRVTLDRPHRVKVRYETGPFRYLNNQWEFVAHPQGCQVAFFVEFEFRSRILQAAIGVVFNEAVRRMVGAFNRRARQIYGPPVAPHAPPAPVRS